MNSYYNLSDYTTMNIKDLNSLFGGIYLPATLTRCRLLSAFGKLLFAHLAQNADSHNLVQMNFLFSVSELGFLDERELIETLDELESFGMILVQRGNSKSELVVAQLMPDFTEILSEREAKGRRKKRTRHSTIYNFKNSQPFRFADNSQTQPEIADKSACQIQSNFGKTVDESVGTMQSELFPPESCGIQPNTMARKANRKQPRSRHPLQDCWNFAQYQRQINGAEKIPTPDRFAVALYTTGQQDDEIDLFLLSREQYHQPQNNDQNVVH